MESCEPMTEKLFYKAFKNIKISYFGGIKVRQQSCNSQNLYKTICVSLNIIKIQWF